MSLSATDTNLKHKSAGSGRLASLHVPAIKLTLQANHPQHRHAE